MEIILISFARQDIEKAGRILMMEFCMKRILSQKIRLRSPIIMRLIIKLYTEFL